MNTEQKNSKPFQLCFRNFCTVAVGILAVNLVSRELGDLLLSTRVFLFLQEIDSEAEKASWSWLPEAELCLPVHSRNVANYKKVPKTFQSIEK